MRKISYLQAIHEAVEEEIKRDSRVFVIGEDVRAWGAPFGEYKGLYKKYPEQILDTPISERAILGGSIGAALLGGVYFWQCRGKPKDKSKLPR